MMKGIGMIPFVSFLATVATVVITWMNAHPTVAATFTVNSTADVVDANPGDGVCATSGAQCTLRAAVQEANALAGSNIIVLPAGIYILTIAGVDEFLAATGDLDITNGILTIDGAGATNTIIDGGGIDRVFEIVNDAATNISGVTIRNGHAGFGGGISNRGKLNLTRCSVSGNTATFLAGGISNDGTMSMTDSSVTNNTGIEGIGGIDNAVTLSSDGILHFGNAVITNSTISGNTSGVGAGGIYNGGLISQGEIRPCVMTLTNVTISDNSAPDGGGIFNYVGSISLRNTIVANSPSGGNCSGTIISLGHNLSSDNTCGFAGPGDLNSTNPLLGPLQDNGGPTFTHALLAGSPAVDAGDSTGVPATDQRGFPRIQNGTVDIGAYELQVGTQQPVAVPGMSEWGMVVFIVVAGSGSVYRLRRHRKSY